MRSRLASVAVWVALGGALLAGCGGATLDSAADSASGAASGAASGGAADGPLVIATTSVWGDMARRVVGDAGRVEVVMAGGEDPHTFQLSARMRGRLAEADLVVANGLGLEAGMRDALDQVAAAGTPVLEVAPALDPLAAGGGHDDEDDGDAHGDEEADGHGELDPHVWLDPVRMAGSGHVIAGALDDVAPGPWAANAGELETDLVALHEQVDEILAAIPAECRVVVANHDAVRYLAVRYDLEVAATVLPGFSTDVEPSARDFAAVVDLVEQAGIRAVLVEDTSSTRLADALADELHGDVAVVTVPLASLGPQGSATGTYEGLMTTLATRVAEALAEC